VLRVFVLGRRLQLRSADVTRIALLPEAEVLRLLQANTALLSH
jgi:hypothetical protein